MGCSCSMCRTRLRTPSTAGQTPEGITLTAHVDTATSQVDGNKMMMKSPGVIVAMSGATSR